MYLRFGAALAALAAGATGIVLVFVLLSGEPGPTSAVSTPSTPTSVAVQPSTASHPGGRIATPDEPGFPSPPSGALVLAQEAGDEALGLAVKPGLVRVSVLSPSGPGQRGLNVSLELGGSKIATKVCGAGCYQAQVHGVPKSPVTVLLGTRAYRFAYPKLPLSDGRTIVAEATSTWKALSTLVWHERLASSATNAIYTVYKAVAPHSLSYTVRGESAAVIIGGSRWDRSTPTGPWQKSVQDPQIDQPAPFWQLFTDARVLGAGEVDGHAVWRISFFDPITPAWFEGWIDQASYRTLELEMITASHFMHDLYGPFDAPIKLSPPSG
jgi:hypothetical protein